MEFLPPRRRTGICQSVIYGKLDRASQDGRRETAPATVASNSVAIMSSPAVGSAPAFMLGGRWVCCGVGEWRMKIMRRMQRTRDGTDTATQPGASMWVVCPRWQTNSWQMVRWTGSWAKDAARHRQDSFRTTTWHLVGGKHEKTAREDSPTAREYSPTAQTRCGKPERKFRGAGLRWQLSSATLDANKA